MQVFLDMLIQIKPEDERNMKINLIKEAMTCILTEIFEIYSAICRGIDQDLLRIYSAKGDREEEESYCSMALEILRKAKAQGEKLCLYFAFCVEFGVLKESECPKIEKVREENICELEQIVDGRSGKELMVWEDGYELLDEIEEVAIVLAPKSNLGERVMTTIITDQWEVFDEDLRVVDEDDHNRDRVISINNSINYNNNYNAANNNKNPFAASCAPGNQQLHHFPDLITF